MKIHSIYTLIIFEIIFTKNQVISNDDFFDLNTSSRFTSIGNIALSYFPELSENSSLNSKFRIHESSIYDNILKVNNAFYTKKIDNLNIFKSKINRINITFFNRKIENISNTSQVWSDEINPPMSPSDIDSNLMYYFNHNDYCLLFDIFFNSRGHNFGFHLIPAYSKTETISSKSFTLDISYSLKLNKVFVGLIFRDIFSFKNWSTGLNETFLPSISLILNKNFKKVNFFVELDDLYIKKYNFNEVETKIGFEYNFAKSLLLRFGVNEDYSSFGFGTELYKKMIIDYSFSNHKYLGDTNQFTFQFELDK